MKKKNIMAIAAIAVMAGSCSSKEELQSLKEPVPIRLTTSVGMEAVTRGADGKVIEKDAVVTRGIQENAITSGEKVYVWANEAGGSSWDYLKAWTLTADGSTGLSGSTKYYPPDGTTITMNAVHGNFSTEPSEDNTAIGTLTHSVVADQSAAGDYEKSDLLFGTATGSKASTSAENIAFAHKLSKIEVNLSAGYGYDATDLATATVHLNNVKPTITIDPTDGSLGSASGTATTITPRKDATTGTYEAVIPPQTFANPDALIAVTTTKDGLTLTSTVPNDVATYADDTRYVYNTTVNILDPGIPLSTVTSAHLGKVIAANGMVYDTKTIADYYSEGVAMISYISSTGSGYGLSLYDTTPSPWSTAGTTAANYSEPHPDGTSWALPTLAQWNNMFAQFGGSPVGTDYACAKPYYSGTIRTKMTECGGQNLEGSYWSATQYNSTIAHDYTFELNYWCGATKTGTCSIRPFFIF